jgi:hypothetical protein
LALLSNENTIYKELNLLSSGNKNDVVSVPNDFYDFLVHRLTNIFNEKINDSVIESKGGSYKRLSEFMLDRSNIKKAIMTIPYNVTPLSMKIYVRDNLYVLENEDDNKEL